MLPQRALGPRLNLIIKFFRQMGNPRTWKLTSTQFGGDALETVCGDALQDHPHQRQHKRLLASLITLKYGRLEGALTATRSL